jgi:cytochrome c oxidase assembly factor CtaG
MVQTIGFPILIVLAWVPYHLRARALARERRPVPSWRQACFAAGLLVLEIAVSPPVDTLSDQLLVAHMAEHLLIGDFAALLLVLGLTGPVIAPLLRNRFVARLRVLAHPGVAIAVWAVNFYAWHSPYLYQAALRHDALHALEHATFLAFGMAVWMALLGPLPKPQWFGNGARLGFIIAVRLVGTVLANILIFGGTVFYPYYRSGDALWHISPVADQVAAGGLMMVEESLLTIGLFCWLFLRVANENEQRQAILDYADQHGLELDEQRAGRAVAAGRGDELLERLRHRAEAATPAREPASPAAAPASPRTAASGPATAPAGPATTPAAPTAAQPRATLPPSR